LLLGELDVEVDRARMAPRCEGPARGIDADLGEQLVEVMNSPDRFDMEISTPSRTKRTHE
jgi:hypothetical protein